MTDPAVAAAQRACSSYDVDHPRRCLEAAAHEALKPLRELHRPVDYNSPDGTIWPVCRGCGDNYPCATAEIIYPESEL